MKKQAFPLEKPALLSNQCHGGSGIGGPAFQI
jgi:hypothetical protein